MATSATTGTTGSRSRPHARKKTNDDAAYMAPPSASTGTKRQAAEKADGEPRVKRKRVEPVTATASSNGKKDAEELQRSSMVCCSVIPMSLVWPHSRSSFPKCPHPSSTVTWPNSTSFPMYGHHLSLLRILHPQSVLPVYIAPRRASSLRLPKQPPPTDPVVNRKNRTDDEALASLKKKREVALRFWLMRTRFIVYLLESLEIISGICPPSVGGTRWIRWRRLCVLLRKRGASV